VGSMSYSERQEPTNATSSCIPQHFTAIFVHPWVPSTAGDDQGEAATLESEELHGPS